MHVFFNPYTVGCLASCHMRVNTIKKNHQILIYYTHLHCNSCIFCIFIYTQSVTCVCSLLAIIATYHWFWVINVYTIIVLAVLNPAHSVLAEYLLNHTLLYGFMMLPTSARLIISSAMLFSPDYQWYDPQVFWRYIHTFKLDYNYS